ncbi:MAG: LL-diaminopimelate aminotransferase [Deltaproteobacteria bacterium]|jgi:LL-diaminopimelate aminotransferase|nr:LL-diaminopimelate aminotransferase [Deltaproteobacteria bacterium]
MVLINTHYQNLAGSYLFAEIAKRLNAFVRDNPDKKLIRLGIGDVTSPLPPCVIKALRRAVDEQATAEGFRGYGPEQGYAFLREAVLEDAFAGLGLASDEIFISDGAKSDVGNFQEIFHADCAVAITDPVYPVYADSNIMAGRRLIYLPCVSENNFIPELPATRPDLIYLCLPNNPTGTVLTAAQLKLWVDYARAEDCIIFFDAAYEAYIHSPGIPHSIYEIEGARDVAVEFRSYSKMAGFTGLRCGYVVVPKSVQAVSADGAKISVRSLWMRRQSTKFNGCAYIVQRAAQAAHTAEGKRETRELIAGYMANAKVIRQAFEALGLKVFGGIDAPYVWVKLPAGLDSWKFFDALLQGATIAGTPGAGFGPSGEGYFRLTGFGSRADTLEAAERLRQFKI